MIRQLLMIILIVGCSLQAQESPKEDFEYLIKQFREAKEKAEFTLSLEYLLKAEAIAYTNELDFELLQAKINIGTLLYRIFSNYGEALNYYLEAFEINESLDTNESRESLILTNIGNIFSSEKEYQKAIYYYEKAYEGLSKNSHHYDRVILAINFSDLYNKLGQPEIALDYLLEVQNLDKNETLEQAWQVNYLDALLLKGQIDEAKNQMNKLFPQISLYNEEVYIGAIELMSRIYEELGLTDSAIYYSRLGLESSQELGARIKLYDVLSNQHRNKEEFLTSLIYKDTVINLKNSLATEMNRGLFESNKVKYQVLEYQNEIISNKNKQRAERILFLTVITLGLIIVFLSFKALKNRMIKHKQAKIIAENKQKITALKVEGLKNNIDQKNRELSAKALYLSSRNQVIEETIMYLTDFKDVIQNKAIFSRLRELKRHIKNDDEWEAFLSHFEQVNPQLLRNLKEKHPSLNAKDIRFLCYVYMNLDTKEISNIFNVTYNAAKKRKMRIKEKIGMSKEASLYDYLLRFNQ